MRTTRCSTVGRNHFCGRKSNFSVTALKKSSRSRVINELLFVNSETCNRRVMLTICVEVVFIGRFTAQYTTTLRRVTSHLSLRREDSFITLDLNEIFSVLTQNFAFLPRKLIFPMVRVSGSQGL